MGAESLDLGLLCPPVFEGMRERFRLKDGGGMLSLSFLRAGLRWDIKFPRPDMAGKIGFVLEIVVYVVVLCLLRCARVYGVVKARLRRRGL